MDKDRYGGFGRVPIMDTVECRPILVVDDDLDACEALSEFLKFNGYTVACAENGQIALAEIRTRPVPPALILLDMLMPVMDGKPFLPGPVRILVSRTCPSLSLQRIHQ
jgi:PleD family two-component response regulator